MKSKEVLNKRKTCRTCLKLYSSSNELVSIFEKENFILPPNTNSIQFSEMLSNISNHLCSMDDLLPKKICFACLNSIRSAYCFKLQSERSYNTLIDQFGSGFTNIKIELCDYVPEQTFDQIESDKMEVDTEKIPELPNITLPPKIIDDIEIKLEPEEEEEFLAEISDVLPLSKEDQIYNESYNYTHDDNDDSSSEFIDDQPDSEMESIYDSKDIEKNINDDKQSASGTSATDSGTYTNAEEPDLLTQQELVKLKCLVCSKQLFSLGSLKRHKRTHATMSCNFCRRKFLIKATLKCHIKSVHPEKYTHFQLNGQMKAIVPIPLLHIPTCCSCNQMFCSMEALYKHHAECDHKCIECNMIIIRKDSYFKHLEKEHGIAITIHFLECPYCSHKFIAERGLREHITRLHAAKKELNTSSIVSHLLSPGSSSNKSEISPSSKKSIIKKVELTRTEFIAKYLEVYQGDYWNCKSCELKLKKKNILRHLINRHVVVKPYKCPFCPIRFQRIEMRLRHLHNDHQDGYKCDTCFTVYEHGNTYLEHMMFVHGLVVDLPANEEEPDIENHNLRFCDKKDDSTTKDQFLERYIKNLSTDSAQCLPCKKNLSKTGINFHLCRYHATEMAYKCAFCIRRFTRTEYRSKHMKAAHPTDYLCYSCNIQFAHHKLYADHMKTAHNFIITTKPESGEEDDIPFNDLRFVPVLTTENKNYHESDFKAPKITKNALKLKNERDEAEKARDLNKPMKKDDFIKNYITKNDKSLTCKVCNITFHGGLLIAHLHRWHSTTMPFNCQICDQGFCRTDALTTHMSKMHPNELCCNFCMLQFNRTNLYVLHMRDSHNVEVERPTNIKPVNISDLLFVLKPDRILQNEKSKNVKVRSKHQMNLFKTLLSSRSSKSSLPSTSTSQSTKIFSSIIESPVTRDEFLRKYTKTSNTNGGIFCNPCNKMIFHKNMSLHLRSRHSTKKSYKCGVCEFEFSYAKSRLNHMKRVHPNDHRCQQCNIQFGPSTSYVSHMKKIHDEIVPDSFINKQVSDIPIDKLMFVQHATFYKMNKAILNARDDVKMEVEEDTPDEVTPKSVTPKMIAPKAVTPKLVPLKIEEDDVEDEEEVLQTSFNSTQHCLECNEDFESPRSYRLHMRIHHIKSEDQPVKIKIEPEEDEDDKCDIEIKQESKKVKNPHTCYICQKTFIAVISLNAHMKFRHKIAPTVDKDEVEDKDTDVQIIPKQSHTSSNCKRNIQHECEVCDVVLFRKDYLLNHIKIVHPGEYICQFCTRVNHSYVDMIHHISMFHKGKIFDDSNLYGCKECYVKFSVKDHLNLHMMEKHVKKPSVSSNHCSPCKATYPIQRLLRHKQHVTHLQLTEIEERLKLNFSSKTNNTVRLKLIPQRRNSVENQGKYYMKYFLNQGSLLICDICKATFTIRKQLIQHLKTHPEIPTFDCKSCPLKFFIKHKYDLHLKTHNDDVEEKSKYSCKICLSLFTKRNNLMIHITVRHSSTDNPNLICGVCGKGHDNEDELTTHFKTHSEEGNNQAQVFVKENTEEAQSDNDSPYCKICKLSFKFKIIQNIHNNMWHNESNLNRNLTIQEQQRLKKEQETNIIKFIKCKLCEEAFIKPDDLDEHLKTAHCKNDSSDDESRMIIDETFPTTSKTDFNCDQCILNFPCQQYLTNHKMYFCKSSPKVVINVSEYENTLNEQ